MNLADVIESLTGNRIEAPQPISHVVVDSRQVTPGSLFVALPGEHTDGHQFVKQAFERGAIAAITHLDLGLPILDKSKIKNQKSKIETPVCIRVENSLVGLQQLARFWRRKFKPRVVGITGSVGKSTSKELIASVLATHFRVLKNEGNLNNEIGLPLTLLQLNETHEYLVLEMGMYNLGEIALLSDFAQPHIGVVTNIGPTHLERLGTIARIVQAKSELVQALPADGVAILNYDDPLVMSMTAQTQARVLTYGLSPESDLWASDIISLGLEGIKFTLTQNKPKSKIQNIKLPLLGRHSVHTALRAALVGLAAGLDWTEIIIGLQSLPSTAQLRLVSVAGPNHSIILDDTYNASPASTIAALNLLNDLTAAKKIAVLGDMLELGSFEEEGHRKVGGRAAQIVDLLITIGSRAKFIADEARACGLKPAQILELENNSSAISYLQQILSPDDVVLIKGSNSQKMNEIVSALTDFGF